MKVSVGICAYNEEQNIGKLLQRLVVEPLVNEVIVVASGCTDKTVEVAQVFACAKLNILVQQEREGKASAVNMFISNAQGDILVLESADTIPSSFCFKHLLKPFEDPTVGMTGAHPIPVNSKKTPMGKVAHLLWEVHHQSALLQPKAGEVCAFRNVIQGIDPQTPVDEASIEYELVKKGYKVVYAPCAVVFNKGPETIEDFFKQRKRIYHGHLMLKQSGYMVPTMNYKQLAQATLKATDGNYSTIVDTVILEVRSRREAIIQFNKDKNKPTIWEVTRTTKEVN